MTSLPGQTCPPFCILVWPARLVRPLDGYQSRGKSGQTCPAPDGTVES
jgi:hypothetical protein